MQEISSNQKQHTTAITPETMEAIKNTQEKIDALKEKMEQKSYDPKLREASDEITAIMKKYDIGGYVHLCSRSHGEFKNHMDTPTWSMIKILENGIELRISNKTDEQKDNSDSTLGMISSVGKISLTNYKMCSLMMQTATTMVEEEGGEIEDNDPVITNEDRTPPPAA